MIKRVPIRDWQGAQRRKEQIPQWRKELSDSRKESRAMKSRQLAELKKKRKSIIS
jgi:hypothetical protein